MTGPHRDYVGGIAEHGACGDSDTAEKEQRKALIGIVLGDRGL